VGVKKKEDTPKFEMNLYEIRSERISSGFHDLVIGNHDLLCLVFG
jgi:hypothetical protein